jgi:Holliday junction resolvasome RuvABC endonuclease subunit
MIAGIDPGKNGAIALLYADGTVYVEDTPSLNKEINGAAIASLLNEFTPEIAVIESVNSFGMGRQSAFNFGQGVGVFKGVLAALEIPYVEVTPAKWKRFYNLSSDKDDARAAAIRLFPSKADLFKRKMDADRAEAALIALWYQQAGIKR